MIWKWRNIYCENKQRFTDNRVGEISMKTLNQIIAGTGYQIYPKKTKIRVENESGDFLFYSRNIFAALKKTIPNGCGGFTLHRLEQLVQNGLPIQKVH